MLGKLSIDLLKDFLNKLLKQFPKNIQVGFPKEFFVKQKLKELLEDFVEKLLERFSLGNSRRNLEKFQRFKKKYKGFWKNFSRYF